MVAEEVVLSCIVLSSKQSSTTKEIMSQHVGTLRDKLVAIYLMKFEKFVIKEQNNGNVPYHKQKDRGSSYNLPFYNPTEVGSRS